MEIRFDGPTFHSPADEARFFEWLRALPGFEGIDGRGKSLFLRLGEPLSDACLRELLIVFHRWRIDPAPLRRFRSAGTANSSLWGDDL